MAKIALNFEDGLTQIIEARAGETVANAASEARIKIPLDCNDGVCGTCKCRIKNGSFDMGDEYIAEAISDNEIAEGYGLACQLVPKSDMVIDILASSAACKVKLEALATTIISLEFVSSEIVKLVVKSQNGRLFNFLPGQYAHIELPKTFGGVSRSYSFCNKAGSDTAEFLIRLLPQGAMSDYLRKEAKVGETLNLTAPFGGFYLRNLEKPTLFFAGGTGIAPFLAMLENLNIANSNASDTEGVFKQPIKLYYGATTDENLVELDKLAAFKAVLPLEIMTCVSDQTSEKHAQGFVTQWITKDNLGTTAYDMYICGPPSMVDAVKTTIKNEQIAQRHFFEEKFIPTAN